MIDRIPDFLQNVLLMLHVSFDLLVKKDHAVPALLLQHRDAEIHLVQKVILRIFRVQKKMDQIRFRQNRMFLPFTGHLPVFPETAVNTVHTRLRLLPAARRPKQHQARIRYAVYFIRFVQFRKPHGNIPNQLISHRNAVLTVDLHQP